MQVLTKRYPKNCLLTVMDRYSAVVRNMEQSICVEVDHGLLPREEWQAKVAGNETSEAENDAAETEEAEEDRISEELDLEAQFHLHFCSLHHILTHLTRKAQEVTRKYQEMTGQVL
ncbi:thyroid hormone responsive SPOT14 homolog (Rattus), isoform CRA_a [Mus musculus]|nr:thyroid hormone responsive SPOT14 homolog (Rattus), isoform CRA_a [Mus musculus]